MLDVQPRDHVSRLEMFFHYTLAAGTFNFTMEAAAAGSNSAAFSDSAAGTSPQMFQGTMSITQPTPAALPRRPVTGIVRRSGKFFQLPDGSPFFFQVLSCRISYSASISLCALLLHWDR